MLPSLIKYVIYYRRFMVSYFINNISIIFSQMHYLGEIVVIVVYLRVLVIVIVSNITIMSTI
jgi:hypothetical protein